MYGQNELTRGQRSPAPRGCLPYLLTDCRRWASLRSLSQMLVAALALLTAGSQCLGGESPASQAAKPKTFSEAVELTEVEAIALAAVRDGNQQLDETAFYMLLAKADGIAQLAGQRPAQLDRPGLGNLADHPERYRGWPIRLTLNVRRLMKLTDPEHFVKPPHWPVDRAIWQMDCYGPAGGAYEGTPLMVFSTIEPLALGEPKRIGKEGESYYWPSREFQIDGFFYKLREGRDQRDKLRSYPVVLAWSVSEPGGGARPAKKAPTAKRYQVLLLFVGGLLIIYLFARRHFRMQARAEQQYHYRPLRDELADADEDRDPKESQDATDSHG